jgi:hypothetical protein
VACPAAVSLESIPAGEVEVAMSGNVIQGAAFLLFVVGVFVYVVILYNELVRLRNDNDRAWANIDVLLKQRHDEIPNLVETVKGYMQHEQQTLVAVTQARAASMNAASIGQKAQADLMMTGALRGLFAVAENYPQLKANENFLKRADACKNKAGSGVSERSCLRRWLFAGRSGRGFAAKAAFADVDAAFEEAPSSMEMRAATTSPVSEPSLRISTRSLAVRLPRTLPRTTISRALMLAATTPLRPMVTRLPARLMEPSTRPSM